MKVYSIITLSQLRGFLKSGKFVLVSQRKIKKVRCSGIIEFSLLNKHGKMLIERKYIPSREYLPVRRRFVSIEAFLVEIERYNLVNDFVSPIDDIPFK